MTCDRAALPALLVLIAGCSSGPASSASGPEGLEGTPMKVSYFRFQREEAKGRLQPVFYMMLSYGWRNRFGPVSTERFERVTTNVFKNVEVADVHMETIVKAVKEKGWDALPATDVAKIDYARIKQIEREGGSSTEIAGPLRWLTISDGTTTKTVSNEDAHRAGPALHRVYLECEGVAFMTLQAMTAKVSVVADPRSNPMPGR